MPPARGRKRKAEASAAASASASAPGASAAATDAASVKDLLARSDGATSALSTLLDDKV